MFAAAALLRAVGCGGFAFGANGEHAEGALGLIRAAFRASHIALAHGFKQLLKLMLARLTLIFVNWHKILSHWFGYIGYLVRHE